MLRALLFIPLWMTLLVAAAEVHAVTEITTIDSQEAQQPIPFKQTETLSTVSLLRVGAILIFVLIVAVALIFALKKFILDKSALKFPNSRIKLIEAKRLSSRLSVFLVSIDEQEYLLSQAGDGNQMLRHERLSSTESEQELQ